MSSTKVSDTVMLGQDMFWQKIEDCCQDNQGVDRVKVGWGERRIWGGCDEKDDVLGVVVRCQYQGLML